jgi:NAD(P)-dependent dehydrogenase (short-subunit alcohol dehydrogenase family)
MQNQTFTDKVCVVTGAASGMGRELAIKLFKAGAAVAISDVNEQGLAETVKLAGAETSNRILVDRLDVADGEAIIAYAEHVRQALGDTDYLFNNAGLTRLGWFEDTPISSMEIIMNVNYWGVVRMSKAFLPQLMATKGGLTNISSIFGIIGYAGQAHYCASKFAVRGFSETLAEEMKDHGVRVSSVHPGGVATNVARNAIVDALPNGATDRAEFDDRFDDVAITSATDAAQIILDGTAKGKRRIMVGKDAKLVQLIQRIFPVSYTKIIKKLAMGNLDT